MLLAHRPFLWLELVERGATASSIASRFKVSIGSVEIAISAARAQVAAFVEARRLMTPPPLFLTFPLAGLFPYSTCPHGHVAIPHGDLACCAVCHRSGRDGHPALDRFPSLEPKPEPPPPMIEPAPEPLTRREKRAAKRAGAVASCQLPVASKKDQTAA